MNGLHIFTTKIIAILRFVFVVALLIGLNTSHFGMAHARQNMPLAHMTSADGGMDHGSKPVHKMNGSLCATICAGANLSEAIVFQAGYVDFATVHWQISANLLWVSPTPDPALRPPDLLHHA